jgi:hypothetical protein
MSEAEEYAPETGDPGEIQPSDHFDFARKISDKLIAVVGTHAGVGVLALVLGLILDEGTLVEVGAALLGLTPVTAGVGHQVKDERVEEAKDELALAHEQLAEASAVKRKHSVAGTPRAK